RTDPVSRPPVHPIAASFAMAAPFGFQNPPPFGFPSVGRKKVVAAFDGGRITSNGGVMLLGGLWHGASWNFVFWGGIHGGMLAFERKTGKNSRYQRLPRAVRVGLTFVIVCLSWVFFCLPSRSSEPSSFHFASSCGVAKWTRRLSTFTPAGFPGRFGRHRSSVSTGYAPYGGPSR
ncbi:hypothetical protein B4Q13_23035, partial [Lacticaseibacillus rhamnosus]